MACVIAVENKYTVLGSSTILSQKEDIEGKYNKTMYALQALIVTNIVFVVMARRPYAYDGQADDLKPLLPKNTLLVSQPHFHALVGPTVLKVLQSGESMVRRIATPIITQQTQLPLSRCKGITRSGSQCKRRVHGNYCSSHVGRDKVGKQE